MSSDSNKAKKRDRGVKADGTAVSRMMKKQSMGVADLAAKARVSESTVKAARSGDTLDKSTFAELAEVLECSPSELQGDTSNVDTGEVPLIAGFVGREKLVQAVLGFEKESPSGVLFLEGEPGIGKSWLVQHLSGELNELGSYFISQTTGKNSIEGVVRGVTKQILSRLTSLTLTVPSTLTGLLASIPPNSLNGPTWLLLDAMDELEGSATFGQNPLALPPALPKYIFVLMSMRPGTPRGTFQNLQVLKIDTNAQENIADLKLFIEAQVGRPGILKWQEKNMLTAKDIVKRLLEKSNGNFMYARQVLDAIDRGELNLIDSTSLPKGLHGYYELQWNRMQGLLGGRVEALDRKVMLWLARQKRPMNILDLANMLTIEPITLGEIINVWQMFLRRSGEPACFSIYHQSFADFLMEKIAPGCSGLADEVLKSLGNSRP